MANSNNICTRFINYLSVLILVFLSSSVNASSFGGGGASGSWDEPTGQCTVSIGSLPPETGKTPNQACSSLTSAMAPGNGGVGSTKLNNVIQNTLPNGTVNFTCEIGWRNSGFNTLWRPSGSCSVAQCPEGYEKDSNGKCQPKKCPVGETLVNGQCQKKQCPAGQALDSNGNCMFADDQCPAGQSLVNGRCSTSDNPDDPEQNPDDPEQNPDEWPTFCEWANEMCSWHKEWQQWSNDYNSN